MAILSRSKDIHQSLCQRFPSGVFDLNGHVAHLKEIGVTDLLDKTVHTVFRRKGAIYGNIFDIYKRMRIKVWDVRRLIFP